MSVLILSRDHAFLRSMYYELCIKFFVILFTFIQGLKFHDISFFLSDDFTDLPLPFETVRYIKEKKEKKTNPDKANQLRKTICSCKHCGCDPNKCYRSPWVT